MFWKDNNTMDKKQEEQLILKVRAFAMERWTLGELHGIKHWDRVYENALRIATPDVSTLVLGLFAYLHDSCRVSDGRDIDHGVRACGLIDTIRETLLAEVPDKDIKLLRDACRYHTTKHKTFSRTVNTCFDADRLDLWRVGVTPDPARLATKKGKEIAKATYYDTLLCDHVDPIMDDRKVGTKTLDWIIFWLYLIPGTVFSIIMSGDCVKYIVDKSVLYLRSPWLVIASGAVFGILSILGLCAIILLLLKKRWEAVVFVTAVFGALFWGYAAVENVPLSYLPMVTKLFYVLVPVWCIFVTGYCYKRWSGTVNFLE